MLLGTKNCIIYFLAGMPEAGVAHHQILAYQLTLSQPGGADYATILLLAPPDFQTFLRPYYGRSRKKRGALSSNFWLFLAKKSSQLCMSFHPQFLVSQRHFHDKTTKLLGHVSKLLGNAPQNISSFLLLHCGKLICLQKSPILQ